MSVPELMFYVFAVLAVLSGAGVLFTGNVFSGALLLLVCLVAVAGIYVTLFAEFVAATQLLVYAGGVVVVIIFGIMLTSKIAGKPLVVRNGRWVSGVIAGLLFSTALIYLFSRTSFPNTSDVPYTTLPRIGIDLMSKFVLPFEVAGILLLVALVGASVFAGHDKTE